jgi:hypothetical protein
MVQGAEEFLGRLREGGTQYLTLDALDGISSYYVYPVVAERVSSFCGMAEVGEGANTRLLGFLTPEERGEGEGAGVGLERCPPDRFRATPLAGEAIGSWQIPLLLWGADREL